MKNNIFKLLIAIAIFFSFNETKAATFTWNGSASNDWNTASNWTVTGGSGTIPTSNDDVKISGFLLSILNPKAANVTLSADAVAKSIELSAVIAGASLDLNGYNLVVSGNVYYSGIIGAPTITIGSGSLVCNEIDMNSFISGRKITISTGSVTCTDLTAADITISSTGIFESSGTVSFLSSGTRDFGDFGTFIYSATSGTQNIKSATYANLTLKGGAKELGSNITIGVNDTLRIIDNMNIDPKSFTIKYNSNGTLIYQDSTNSYSRNAGAEWPASDGPQSVILDLIGNYNPKVTMPGSRDIDILLNIITGNLSIDNATLTLNGEYKGNGKLIANGSSSNLSIGGTGAFGSISFLQSNPGVTNRLNNLTLNRTSGTVSLADTLEIIGILSTNLGTLTTNGKIILAANTSTNYGQMSGAGTGTISGNVKVEKVLEDIVAGWRHFSLPVQTTVDSIFGLQVRTTSNPVNQQSIYYWDTTRNGSTQFAKGWTVGTTSDNQSKAYSIYNNNANTGVHELNSKISVKGALTQADYTIPLANHADPLNPSGGSVAYGWNFIPNRFASNIDVGALISDGDFVPAYKAIHVYDRAANQYVGINQSSLINYNTPSNIDTINNIAPWQGFWVKADSSGQSIQIKKSHQTTDMTNANQFMKSAPDYMRLNVQDNNGFMDQIAVMFATDATESFDGDKDMYKLKSLSGEVPSLFILENQTEQCATALPYTQKRTVKLAFQSYINNQNYTFSPDFDNFDFSGDVILEDLKTGTLTDLRSANYEFTHDNSFDAQRFLLHFNKTENTSSVNTDLNKERTYVYGGEEGIMVHFANAATGTDGSVTIYNALGQQVYNSTVANGQTINFKPTAPMQVYLVSILTNGIAKTHKLLY